MQYKTKKTQKDKLESRDPTWLYDLFSLTVPTDEVARQYKTALKIFPLSF